MSASAGFFHDGAAYERLMGRWSIRVAATFLEWVDLPKALQCLDVGCGTGAFTQELITRCSPAAVTAIDPAAAQLAFARQRAGLEAVEFHVGDAQSLPFADDEFDVAVMALVMHFVAEPSKAVAEMARVVRPGGRIATYVWDYATAGSPVAPLTAAMRSLGIASASPPSANATSLQALQELWQSAGLEHIEVRPIRITVSFADFDEFWNSMTVPAGPAGETIARMSPDTLGRLRDALKEQAGLASDGRVIYEARANAIKGRVPAP